MKTVSTISLALALVAAASPNWAAQHDQHKGHHPAGSPPMSKTMPGKTTPEMARMANHMKAMQEMHDKMMAAKTPEERNALMAEHMTTMQEGMAAMKSMGGMGGMNGMGGKEGMGGMSGMAHAKATPANMAQRQTMMEQRMDMMQSMMEMMADRLPQMPAKP
jgi:hypothetical protein